MTVFDHYQDILWVPVRLLQLSYFTRETIKMSLVSANINVVDRILA